MITIKNASQIAKMREAGALLHEVLEQLKGKIEPGITTKELDRYAEKLIRGYGAVPSFLNYEGYPASICASVDSQVVHGIPNESTVLREGQIISIDSGLILDGWQSDSAFTVGVGTVSPEAQRLIDVTEQSFFAALQVAREGYRAVSYTHLDVYKRQCPKGQLEQTVNKNITVKVEGNEVHVTRPNDEKQNRAFHGLYRALIANMVVGVTEGYKKTCLLYTSRCV